MNRFTSNFRGSCGQLSAPCTIPSEPELPHHRVAIFQNPPGRQGDSSIFASCCSTRSASTSTLHSTTQTGLLTRSVVAAVGNSVPLVQFWVNRAFYTVISQNARPQGPKAHHAAAATKIKHPRTPLIPISSAVSHFISSPPQFYFLYKRGSGFGYFPLCEVASSGPFR